LRTPLSSIKWFIEMMLDGDFGKLKKEQKDVIEDINSSNERMISLVNSLLNVSRIESGRIIVDPEPTNLGELIKKIIEELKAKLDERKQKIIFSSNSKLEKINIDTKLIREVITNLLTNAMKYSPEKSEILVFLSKKNKEIVVQVSDDGYGIPKDEQTKIFQRFFRASNITKKETDGTGLGLYLVKSIIESSGGKIWLESEEGKGTTFWFTLPIKGMQKKEGVVSLNN